jgi:crotonobetainyl-CoA:carnitine CoA-transferase CaiB-like acyl-CoA transferase
MSVAGALGGLKLLELGSRVAAPYVGKLFADAGATVLKVESPRGDPFREWSASGASLDGSDAAWFQFLNAGKSSVVVDLEASGQRDRLLAMVGEVDLVIDDHLPAAARTLGISPADLKAANPAAVVATLTPFGTQGPWADRPANDFILQALVGATDARGVPGEEPVYCGGDLGDFVAASLAAPGILAATLAARSAGRGVHIDASQFEAMMLAFQQYRPIYDVFAPTYRPGRQIEIPSVEPARDGLVGFCTITGQQWQDFCALIGAPDMAEDEDLASFDGRMKRRDEVWGRIRAFTAERSVEEIVEQAQAFRIPAGPIGTGDLVAGFDHFVERGVFVESPHGFLQPRPPYQFSETVLAPPRRAPELGESAELPASEQVGPTLGADPSRPLDGIRVLDLSAFWAGPFATNLFRVLGADLIKVESHVRLDGMRWSSGPIPVTERIWEWSPVYHGANVGKKVVNLDLSSEAGREILMQLIADADVVLENFSPRVVESWGVTWDKVHELNPRAVFIRVPAFGTDGPWRDRVGFAMTMEQVSGLANRTGHPDGPPLVPKGPVDTMAGMHSVFAAILALVERERTGEGQLVELPLIEAALQAAAEQVVEYSAYGAVLGRLGNRSPAAAPQGLYMSSTDDVWLALSVESDSQWDALVDVVGAELVGEELGQLDRHSDHDRIDEILAGWSETRTAELASAQLFTAGVPASACVHFNDAGAAPQHDFRGFFQWKEHPVTGWTPYPSYPFQVDGEHVELGAPAPLLGQHNAEVLASLGYDDAAIAGFVESGVTGDWPAMVPRPGI